jgi:hypothetical protein
LEIVVRASPLLFQRPGCWFPSSFPISSYYPGAAATLLPYQLILSVQFTSPAFSAPVKFDRLLIRAATKVIDFFSYASHGVSVLGLFRVCLAIRTAREIEQS